MHHRNAVIKRVAGANEVDGLALHFDGSGVFLINAKKALHQSALSRAVLSHQRVHSTALELELRAVKRLDAGKGLINIEHFKQIGFFHVVFTSSLI